jgi:hypothetical protein
MGNASKMTPEQYEAFKKAHEEAQDDGLLDVVEPNTDTATCAMLGAGYQLGNIMIPQVTPTTMALLSIAGISIVSDSDDDGDTMRDLVLALYIIAGGAQAAHALMGVKRRIDALKKLEGLANKSADMFDRYMNKLDEIGGGAYAQIEADAFAWTESIEGFTFDEAFDVLGQMFRDIKTPMGLLPPSDGCDGKKK